MSSVLMLYYRLDSLFVLVVMIYYSGVYFMDSTRSLIDWSYAMILICCLFVFLAIRFLVVSSMHDDLGSHRS